METTFAGAGVISGDLTPECAAVVTAVLDALSAPMGAEDTRSREQRYHDALEDAMQWLGFCIVIDVTSASLASLRTQALGTPGCCRARLPRHRPRGFRLGGATETCGDGDQGEELAGLPPNR